MEVKISNTSADSVTLEAGGTSYTGVKTTKSEADTKIQVHNNQTVVIGGLVTQSKNKSGSSIPILDKIPILGPILFSSKDTKHEKRNLLLFMTPHIVTGTREAMASIHPEAYDMLIESQTEPTEEKKSDAASSDTTVTTPE